MVMKEKESEADFDNGYFASRTIVNRTEKQRPQPAVLVLVPLDFGNLRKELVVTEL
jgi:hypothetical protein